MYSEYLHKNEPCGHTWTCIRPNGVCSIGKLRFFCSEYNLLIQFPFSKKMFSSKELSDCCFSSKPNIKDSDDEYIITDDCDDTKEGTENWLACHI